MTNWYNHRHLCLYALVSYLNIVHAIKNLINKIEFVAFYWDQFFSWFDLRFSGKYIFFVFHDTSGFILKLFFNNLSFMFENLLFTSE